MPVKGTPAFDSVAILDIEAISFMHADPELVAHGAFVNSKNGKTYGHTTCRSGWSSRTRELLSELRASMEEDLANLVFTGDSTAPTQAEGQIEVGGIGEYVAGNTEVQQA